MLQCRREHWLEHQIVLMQLLNFTRWGKEEGTDGRISFRGEMG